METKFINIYINRYGFVFPSCKTYKDQPIVNLTSDNAAQTVFEYFGEKFRFNSITIEFSSSCHANCLYCFQHDGVYKKYGYFDDLTRFLDNVETERLFCSGGEILDQPDTINYLKSLRKKMPNTHFHLKTNGNADINLVEFVENVFNSVVISFNGFHNETCRLIMGNNINVQKTILFTEHLVKNKKTNVGIKFLISPIVTAEIIPFFKWALDLQPRCIIFQTAYRYKLLNDGLSIREGLTFDDYNNDYWMPIKQRIVSQLKELINSYSVNCGFNALASDPETAKVFSFDDNLSSYFRMDGVYDLEDET